METVVVIIVAVIVIICLLVVFAFCKAASIASQEESFDEFGESDEKNQS